ncbi:MAG: potassium channel family protein [Cytophagaceae bacterium]
MKVFRILLLFLLIVFGNTVNASQKVMSLNDIYQSMLSNHLDSIDGTTVGHSPAYYALNGFLGFRQTKFEFQRATDEYWDKRYLNGGEQLIVNKGIAFEDCEFPEVFWFLFRNIVFNETVSFVQTTNIRFKYKDCVFKGPVQLRVGTVAQFMEFENCTFERGFEVLEGAHFLEFLTFKNCTFHYNESFITNPRVRKDQFNIGELRACPRYFYFANNQDELDCSFINCTFKPVVTPSKDFTFHIDLSHSAFKSLEFTNCNLDVPMDLSFVTVNNQFKIFTTAISGIAAEAISFNSSNAKIDWEYFKNQKLKVRTDSNAFLGGKDVVNNKFLFESLISIYALLYESYKEQGNRLSANSCYVEWKNIERDYLAHQLTLSYDVNTWFSWFMDEFLYFFCDYGTNPFKSLMWSLVVMLIFTMLFFIALWNRETSEHQDMRIVLKNFGMYFTHNKSFIEIATAISKYKEENEGEDLREYIESHKNVLPTYFTLFSLRMSMKRFHFPFMFLFRWADKILGKWDDASQNKKQLIKVIVGVWVVVLTAKILLIRVFDAFTMSLNSFSTLGYGELPQNEIVRYMTIIEGFIGWFLLSIFSVALISQIIQ